MSVAALDPFPSGRGPSGPGPLGPVLRWGGAAVLVLALHAGGGWLAVHWRQAPPESDGLPPAIFLDLSPVAAGPQGEVTDLPPGPPTVEAAPEPTPDVPEPIDVPPDDIPPVSPVPPDPVAEKPPEPQEMPVPEPLPVKLDLPELPAPPPTAVVLPPSRPVMAQKPPPPARKKVETKKAVNKELPPAARTTAEAGAPKAADQAAAPGAGMGTSSKAALATWRGRLIAHLVRHKRPVGRVGARSATLISTTIDRSGAVLSASIARTSGDPEFDDEALALVRRANPLPAPPDDVFPGKSRISFTLPIDLKR